MNIGIVPDPTHANDWPQIKALLEPAAKRGGVLVLEEHEEVWTVYDGELLAAATARILPEDRIGEIVLVGGRDRKQWLAALAEKLGQWFALEGMTAMRAYGRKGWKRELEMLGWHVIGQEGKTTGFERVLR